MTALTENQARAAMRSCIQKVATGPEYSKDLSFDEARTAMQVILAGHADPVQAAIFLIALRMKRETDEENKGVLRAMHDATQTVEAPVDDILDLADPYDGYARELPASPFLPPVLAACGLPTVSHGLEYVGPKFGITHRKVLRAAGVDVDLAPAQAAERLGHPDQGWGYLDQKAFCPALHDLVDLRTRIVKRPCLTTVEVLAGPVRGRARTHFMSGYVHKAYPPIYTMLAREAGFDTAVIVRGTEGGVIPSLQQSAQGIRYGSEGIDEQLSLDPAEADIHQSTRSVPIPAAFKGSAEAADEIDAGIDTEAAAEEAARLGVAALEGEAGPTRDSLVYGGAIALQHTGRAGSLAEGAGMVREVLDSGAALARFRA